MDVWRWITCTTVSFPHLSSPDLAELIPRPLPSSLPRDGPRRLLSERHRRRQVPPLLYAFSASSRSPVFVRRYATLIKPIAISSTNQSLLQNLSETYNRVTKVFDFSSLWTSATTATTGSEAPSEEQLEEEAEKAKAKETGPPKVGRFPKRPGGGKRMPSERPMGVKEFEVVSRAEKR